MAGTYEDNITVQSQEAIQNFVNTDFLLYFMTDSEPLQNELR